VFYSVSYVGGTQDLSKYFEWQCQQITKNTTQLRLLKNIESFDQKMEQLSIDFNKSICEDINIYAYVEVLPIDNKWGDFHLNIWSIQLGSIVEHFVLCYKNMCWFNF
jgi:hypothetical protein